MSKEPITREAEAIECLAAPGSPLRAAIEEHELPEQEPEFYKCTRRCIDVPRL